MKPQIVFFDAHVLDQDYFRSLMAADFDLKFTEDGLTPDSASLAAAAQVISVHVSSPVTAGIMATMPKLAHVSCRSTGYDNVDLEYAAQHDITVSTVPSYGEATVAEYAMLLLLSVSRRLIDTINAVHEGVVTPEDLTGHDLSGKTLGVIGAGRIGRHVAGIAKGFGMKVVAFDSFPNPKAAEEVGFSYAPLDEVLAQADYLSLHAPATPETLHLLNAEALAKTKRGVVIVNTSRGNVVDTPALIEALRSGQVAGAGLDVLEGEDYLQFSSELHLLGKKIIGDEAREVLGIDILSKMPNVLITAHNAYNSEEALGRIRATSAANIRAWNEKRPENLVAKS